MEGVLPACSEEPVKVIVRPSTSSQYNCTIKYQLIDNTNTENTSESIINLKHLAHVGLVLYCKFSIGWGSLITCVLHCCALLLLVSDS